MSSSTRLKDIFNNAKSIILIFIALAILMVSSALIELVQSKKEILQIMEGQVHSLLESITVASQNTLKTTQYIDELVENNALNFDPLDPTYLEFKKNIGFGVLLRRVVSQNPRIIYAALQDSSNILAASGNVYLLEAIPDSPFLQSALEDSIFLNRITNFDSLSVFEAVHPFSYKNQTLGLLRIGLSMEPVQIINQRIYRRLIIITIVLIAIGLMMFIYLFTRQRYSILKKQYSIVETYSGNIIENVSDSVIVLDNQSGIKIFNKAAEILFNTDTDKVRNKPLDVLFEQENCLKMLAYDSFLKPLSCVIGGQKKYLLISKSKFTDSDGVENEIMVVRDLTQEKMLEEQMERKQRLTAMGELASGVAHEIRNPLNTISTIVQQLNKDFEPQEEKEEYHQLAELVYNEVNRINQTVRDFLRFSRPEPIQPSNFLLSAFLENVHKQFESSLSEKRIILSIDQDWDGQVNWDQQQIRQVFINIIQNAIEAITGKEGTIQLTVANIVPEELTITIRDTGSGIKKETLANIFNLYFTTKAKGTGIGLSIVQRIIYEHGGIITVESEQHAGTVFILKLPIIFKNNLL